MLDNTIAGLLYKPIDFVYNSTRWVACIDGDGNKMQELLRSHRRLKSQELQELCECHSGKAHLSDSLVIKLYQQRWGKCKKVIKKGKAQSKTVKFVWKVDVNSPYPRKSRAKGK